MTGARTAPGPWAGHPSTTELDVTTCHSTAEAEDLCPAWSSSHSAPKPRMGPRLGVKGLSRDPSAWALQLHRCPCTAPGH